jgi:hypothetical protein
MSLPTARKDSNAPDADADFEPSTGEVAMVGFTKMDYEPFRPARLNTDIKSTENSIGGEVLGQDGTSINAYQYQPDTIDADDPQQLDVAVKGQHSGLGAKVPITASLHAPGKELRGKGREKQASGKSGFEGKKKSGSKEEDEG